MCCATKTLVLVGVLIFGALLCSAQLPPESVDAAQAADLDKAADQFINRVHQSLDFSSLNDCFMPDAAARYRDYPGDFMPFETPRVSKSLLTSVDDTTLRRKLISDWNLHYWMSLLELSAPRGLKPDKILPAEFAKAARKSKYLRNLVDGSGPITLTTPAEMSEYLAEADQLGAMLKRALNPELPTSASFRAASDKLRAQFGPPRMVPDAMGYERAYTLARDAMMLVIVQKDGQYKLVSVAPLPD